MMAAGRKSKNSLTSFSSLLGSTLAVPLSSRLMDTG